MYLNKCPSLYSQWDHQAVAVCDEEMWSTWSARGSRLRRAKANLAAKLPFYRINKNAGRDAKWTTATQVGLYEKLFFFLSSFESGRGGGSWRAR